MFSWDAIVRWESLVLVASVGLILWGNWDLVSRLWARDDRSGAPGRVFANLADESSLEIEDYETEGYDEVFRQSGKSKTKARRGRAVGLQSTPGSTQEP